MATIKKCKACNAELQVHNVDYFDKRGIILLAILGAFVTAVFYYTVITTTQDGNIGKFLGFGTIAIFTLIFKVSNMKRNLLVCPLCVSANSPET